MYFCLCSFIKLKGILKNKMHVMFTKMFVSVYNHECNLKEIEKCRKHVTFKLQMTL